VPTFAADIGGGYFFVKGFAALQHEGISLRPRSPLAPDLAIRPKPFKPLAAPRRTKRLHRAIGRKIR
jgi:hypothetical protein